MSQGLQTDSSRIVVAGTGDCSQQLSLLDASDRKFGLTHEAQQALFEVGSESRIYD